MTDTKQKKKSKEHKKQEAAPIEEEEVEIGELKDDYVLKPSNEKSKLDTSQWPLLLKVLFSLFLPQKKIIFLLFS